MVKTIAHMVLEDEDARTGKKPMKWSKAMIVALIASMIAVIALGLAAKALSDVADLRSQLAITRELTIPPRVPGSPSIPQILHDDSTFTHQNASAPLEKGIGKHAYASEEAMQNVQSLLSGLQNQVINGLKDLNQTTQFLEERVSRTYHDQTYLMKTVRNLSSDFYERDDFHGARGEAFIHHVTFLLQKGHEFSANIFLLKLNVSDNAEKLLNLGFSQQHIARHFNALRKYIVNATNKIWERLDSVDSRFLSIRNSMEDQKQGFIEEMHKRFTSNSLEIQDLEDRISMNRNLTLKELDTLRQTEDWTFNHLRTKVEHLRGDVNNLKVKTENHTDEIKHLHNLAGRLALHAWKLSRATISHEARINLTEYHINNTKNNKAQEIAYKDDLFLDVLDNAEQTVKVMESITRLEKDFCEFVGLIYGKLCIRMAYARGPDVNFTRATEVCESQGGTLTDIENDVMIDLVADMVKSTYRGNAGSVELWIGNTFQNGNVITSDGQQVSLSKWHHRPNPAPRRSTMELYVDLDLGAPTGVFPVARDVPHFTPLCSFQFDE